jgi:hypothetical protein
MSARRSVRLPLTLLVTTEIVCRELDVSDRKLLGSCIVSFYHWDKAKKPTRMKSGLKGSKTVILEHVQKSLVRVRKATKGVAVLTVFPALSRPRNKSLAPVAVRLPDRQ